MRRKNSMIIAAVACAGLLSHCSASKKSANASDSAEIIYFDDFNGSSLDRSKWNVYLTGMVFNNEMQAYVDSSATIYLENGSLVLHPRYAPGFKTDDSRQFDFISGRINTRNKVEFTYGTVAARIKMTSGTGLWPAWWMLGGGGWPETGEIDIMEFVGEDDWINAAVHGPGYSGETPFVNRVYFGKENDITQWHVYSLSWTEKELVFKVDDKPFYRITKAMVEHYGKWVFDGPSHLILNYALGGGYPAKVNGIKSPYNGVPQETVELIKNNKCKMLIDWVKVTRLQK